MGDFFGAFKGLVRGGIDVLLTPIRSRKRNRPSEVVDEVVSDRQEGRPAKRRLAMSEDELVRAKGPPTTPLPTTTWCRLPCASSAARKRGWQ